MIRARSIVVLAVLIAGGTLALGAHGAARAPSAFVRVNQLGYPVSAPKRAYLMSSVPETGATYGLRRSSGGPTVLGGRVGSSVGRWSARFPYVYALDFDGVVSAGTYAVDVAGPAGASSPPFAIDSPATLYAGALHNALSFYENERDGPDFIRSPLRTAPGHLNDEHARTYLTPKVDENGAFKGDLKALPRFIDAAGGWWDAGDYLKFVQTTSYTVALMLTGVRDFPAEMGAPAGNSDFKAEARFGAEWLLRMWNGRTRTLYYQVGIGDGNAKTISDHDIWRLPQADDHYGGHNPLYRYIRHRPVFRAGPPGSPISPNLAGRDAAAFGLCFQVFRRSDRRLAARCLRAGEHIFALANTHPTGHLLTAIPVGLLSGDPVARRPRARRGRARRCARGSRSSGGLPHRRPLYYLRQAARWARAYIAHSRHSADTLNLYDVSGLAHYELIRAIARFGDPRGLAVGRGALLADLQRELSMAVEIGRHDPFGFGFPWDVEDTGSHGFGLSVMASEYASLTGSQLYRTLSVRWLGNVLGANAWGVSLSDRRRGEVPRLSATPGRQYRRVAQRTRAGARRRRRRGTEQRRHYRIAHPHATLSGEWRRSVCRLQQQGRVPRQRAVLLDGRARDRSHRVVAAGVRLADRLAPAAELPPVS